MVYHYLLPIWFVFSTISYKNMWNTYDWVHGLIQVTENIDK